MRCPNTLSIQPGTSDLPQWSTASNGLPAEISPTDLEVLQSHILCCTEPLQLGFILQNTARKAYGFMTTRVASFAIIIALLLAVLARIW